MSRLFALWALVACLLLLSNNAHAKNVEVTLEAKWRQTPLLAEGLEALARWDQGYFWIAMDVITELAAAGGGGALQTQRAQYEAFINVVIPKVLGNATSAHQRGLLALELSSRVYSPLVEMQRQRANEALAQRADKCAPSSDQVILHDSSQGALVCGAAAIEEYVRAAITTTGACAASDCDATAGARRNSTDLLAGGDHDDHVHPAVAAPSTGGGADQGEQQRRRTMTLYGVIGSAATARAHRATVKAAQCAKYVFRHAPVTAPADEWATPVALQGFGVTLDIKNMEYKAVDERKGDAQTAAEGGTADASEDASSSSSSSSAQDGLVAGFDIAKLKRRKPHLAAQLTDFAEDVVSQMTKKVEDPEMELKVWELHNLGIQAAYKILQSEEKLEALADLLNNFPLRAAEVSQIPVDDLHEVQNGVRELHKLVGEASNAYYINGRALKAERADLFSVLEALREEEAYEQRVADVLRLDGTSEARREVGDAQALMDGVLAFKSCDVASGEQPGKARNGPSSSPASPRRFWLAQEQVTWLNNIQKDPQYRQFGANIREILRHNYYGQPQFPRKNIFHAVYVLDPGRRDSVRHVFGLLRMLEQAAPLRFGLVLVDTASGVSASGTEPASSETLRASIDANGNLVELRGAEAGGEAPTVSAYATAVFDHLRESKSVYDALHFLSSLYDDGAPDMLTFDDVLLAAKAGGITEEALHELVSHEAAVQRRAQTAAYFADLGITDAPVVFFNGLLFKENLDYAINIGFSTEFPLIREWVSSKELSDAETNIYDFIMENGGAMKRYQPLIFDFNIVNAWASPQHARLLASRLWTYSSEYEFEVPALSHVISVDASTIVGLEAARRAAEYMANCGASCRRARAGFLFCDSGSSIGEGSQKPSSAILAALHGMLSKVERLNEKTRAQQLEGFLRLILQTLRSDSDLRSEERVEAALGLAAATLGAEYFQLIEEDAAVERAAADQAYCALVAKSTGGIVSAVHTNGRMTLLDATFRTSDFALLEQSETRKAFAVASCLEQVEFTRAVSGLSAEELTSVFYADRLFQALSIAGADQHVRGPRVASDLIPNKNRPYAFVVAGKGVKQGATRAKHEIVAVVDPVARESQRMVNIVKLLTDVLDINAVVCLNPPASLTKVPIKNFYSYVGTVEPAFNSQGHLMPPRALFRHMPTKVVLTMGVDEPEAWMVFATEAEHDLDNIKLDGLPRHVLTLRAEYTLENILVTGSCVDDSSGSPPRGLPLVMAARAGVDQRELGATDTLVMSNYGYFQLQGNPGEWFLSIRTGRASDIYRITDFSTSSGGAGQEEMGPAGIAKTATAAAGGGGGEVQSTEQNDSTGTGDVHRPLRVASFTGLHVTMSVRKREGKMGESILVDTATPADRASASEGQQAEEEDDGAGGGFLSGLLGGRGNKKKNKKEQGRRAGTWPPPKSDQAERPERPTLNIFSVASGHLYERFLRMMMYTVMQSSSDRHGANTTRIKFWLIENFLSPQFKRFLPRLAAKYGFEFGLVTYRWPHWLRRQTEKQRTIWGYKILFLDVLFPLEVEKIIFVDADQIVREDLHELYNLDMQGRAVAYTPFCRKNKNPATKGFRFWDSGYWVDHLRGKPYHISAIYVVDLKRLRLMAAGDQYRMIYDNLSADPNSLANLDQDLPNFAQHQVPILSLPEEWLWCETWCTEESKASAKTIDLCNNPLTKTPKLENAKRIIPDWERMDEMLMALEREQ